MASVRQAPPSGRVAEIGASKPRGRLIEVDILRGFLLLWMTLTHLPTKANIVSNQTFGFVSGAEGFIFLSAFMVGQLEMRIEQKRGFYATIQDLARRTVRIYFYHCALLAIAFTIVAEFGVRFHRMAIQNLLSFYLQDPKHAIIAAAALKYRPSLLDILPMYIVFMALTPIARAIAKRWNWDVVIAISFAVWTAAQFGLRAWMYRHFNLLGVVVPETSTGAFDLYAWQFLWMTGLALGSIYAETLAADAAHPPPTDTGIPRSILALSAVIASVFLVLRYSPLDHWMNPDVYNWLVDKWHLGSARVINFSAIAILLVRYGTRIASLWVVKPLASLGQASLEVFSIHVLFCVAGDALSHDPDPSLPIWQQAILLVVTISGLFATAHFVVERASKKRAQSGH